MPSDEKIKALLQKHEQETEATMKAIGIERHFRPVGTIYNSASSIIVASVERHSAHVFERRFFFRHVSERSYRPIASPAADIHYDDLITSPTLPAIYYTVRRITQSERPGEFGGDWLSVERFDLVQHTAEAIITKGGMPLPEPYSNGWVSLLFSVTPDDGAVLCSCGLERREKGKVHYWACSIAPRSQSVTLLTRLEGVWF
jgi:hypothetical protein